MSGIAEKQLFNQQQLFTSPCQYPQIISPITIMDCYLNDENNDDDEDETAPLLVSRVTVEENGAKKLQYNHIQPPNKFQYNKSNSAYLYKSINRESKNNDNFGNHSSNYFSGFGSLFFNSNQRLNDILNNNNDNLNNTDEFDFDTSSCPNFNDDLMIKESDWEEDCSASYESSSKKYNYHKAETNKKSFFQKYIIGPINLIKRCFVNIESDESAIEKMLNDCKKVSKQTIINDLLNFHEFQGRLLEIVQFLNIHFKSEIIDEDDLFEKLYLASKNSHINNGNWSSSINNENLNYNLISTNAVHNFNSNSIINSDINLNDRNTNIEDSIINNDNINSNKSIENNVINNDNLNGIKADHNFNSFNVDNINMNRSINSGDFNHCSNDNINVVGYNFDDQSENSLKAYFDLFDVNKDGKISSQEVKSLYSQLGIDLSDKLAIEMLKIKNDQTSDCCLNLFPNDAGSALFLTVDQFETIFQEFIELTSTKTES